MEQARTCSKSVKYVRHSHDLPKRRTSIKRFLCWKCEKSKNRPSCWNQSLEDANNPIHGSTPHRNSIETFLLQYFLSTALGNMIFDGIGLICGVWWRKFHFALKYLSCQLVFRLFSGNETIESIWKWEKASFKFSTFKIAMTKYDLFFTCNIILSMM